MAHDELPAPVAADATIDLGQAGCGDLTPLIRGRLRELQSGQVLEVISEEPAAHEGIPAWSRLTGNELLATITEPSRSRFFIRKKSARGGRQKGYANGKDPGKRNPRQ